MKVIHFYISQDKTKVNELGLIYNGRKVTFVNSKIHNDRKCLLQSNDLTLNKITTINVTVDAYTCSIVESLLNESEIYTNFLMKLMYSYYGINCRCIRINVNIVDPPFQVFDKRGNRMFEQLGLERRELDHAMAWFSTLGGAFSALGDNIEHCAIMAGKISQQQFKLALRLKDPLLLARCRLYMALSLIQRKFFREAKHIIKSEYALATVDNLDLKLIAMCRGIWAKWKYDKSVYKAQLKILKYK